MTTKLEFDPLIEEGLRIRKELADRINWIRNQLRYDPDPELQEGLALGLEAIRNVDIKLRELGHTIN